MNLTPEQQKERESLLADMDALRTRVEQFCGAPNNQDDKPWPQIGDEYLSIGISGLIFDNIWSNDANDNKKIAIGNAYRPENRKYAERHVEAMEVQAELRRMPGVCAPPDGPIIRWGILQKSTSEFYATCTNNPSHAVHSLCGVWFAEQMQAEHAIKTITPKRLTTFRDDYLQVPI